MRLNNTSVVLNYKTYQAKLNSNNQVKICHKKLEKEITFDEYTTKIIQVSNNEFISFNENHGNKNFNHYYLYGIEKYTRFMNFKYSFYKQLSNSICSFTLSEDERQLVYNAEKHIMFFYSMMPLSDKPLVIDNQIFYPFITTKFNRKFKIYFNENLIPVMIQDIKKEEYQSVNLLEGETYKEALDRTILTLKQDRSLKRVPWKE